jgi:small subunit ribosomal protein S16
MATKIRLQRHGRKGRPIFTIVAADSRAKRDGKYIENLGQYNPNTNPATIDLDFERALDWVMKGAEPTNTALAILKYKGVMMKKHLLLGVQKGALTAEQAEERFESWAADKAGRIDAKIETLNSNAKAAKEERLKAEAAVKEARAAAIAAKNAPAPEVVEEAEEAAAEAAEEVVAEEAPAVQAAEEVVVAEEAPAVQAAEEVVAEEAPAAEATEEAPAAEASEEASEEAAAE